MTRANLTSTQLPSIVPVGSFHYDDTKAVEIIGLMTISSIGFMMTFMYTGFFREMSSLAAMTKRFRVG